MKRKKAASPKRSYMEIMHDIHEIPHTPKELRELSRECRRNGYGEGVPIWERHPLLPEVVGIIVMVFAVIVLIVKYKIV